MVLTEMKIIPNFPDYAITKDGRVWSKPRRDRRNRVRKGVWLKAQKFSNGYLCVALCSNEGVKYIGVHRLVLMSYIGPCPPGMEACHYNGNRADNRLENLRWDTRSNNHLDAVRHRTHTGLYPKLRNICKITRSQAKKIKKLAQNKIITQRRIAKMFDVSPGTVSDILRGRSWKSLNL